MYCCGVMVNLECKQTRYRHRKKFPNCNGLSKKLKTGPKTKQWATEKEKAAHTRKLWKNSKIRERERVRNSKAARKEERRKRSAYL